MDVVERIAAAMPSRGAGETDGDALLRERLHAAVLAEVAERGYAASTVAGVCRRAGVPPTSFHAMFSNRDECFLAALSAYARTLTARVARALNEARGWREGLRLGLGAFLTEVAEHPTEARACLVEALDAGPAAIQIRDATMRTFARYLDLLQERAPNAAEQPLSLSVAAVGGIYETVTSRVRRGETTTMAELLSPMTYFLLAPVVGCGRARQELLAKPA